jgi:hypothetical protein
MHFRIYLFSFTTPVHLGRKDTCNAVSTCKRPSATVSVQNTKTYEMSYEVSLAGSRWLMYGPRGFHYPENEHRYIHRSENIKFQIINCISLNALYPV